MIHMLALAASLLTPPAEPSPVFTVEAVPTDDFFRDIDQQPAVMTGVAVELALEPVVTLELRYMLSRIGTVSIVLQVEHNHSAFGLVTVNREMIAEVDLAGDKVAWKWTDYSSLERWQVKTVMASLVQVWRTKDYLTAISHATNPGASCSDRCTELGVVAGATVSVAASEACTLLTHQGPSCVSGGWWTGSLVRGWVSGSCASLVCE